MFLQTFSPALPVSLWETDPRCEVISEGTPRFLGLDLPLVSLQGWGCRAGQPRGRSLGCHSGSSSWGWAWNFISTHVSQMLEAHPPFGGT